MQAAILLSAGYGTRLRPVTLTIPKPAVPFLGHPMIWYAMNAIRSAGITACAANVHYLPDRMASTLKQCAQDLNLPEPLIYRENEEILGTGGGARECMKLLPDAERFIIYHGDVLSSADLTLALQDHIQSGASVSLVLAPRPDNSKLGMIGVDQTSSVVQIRDWKLCSLPENAAITPACFTGIHIVERSVLENLPQAGFVCLVTEIYKNMLMTGQKIHAIMNTAFFADIGTPETYFEAQNEVVKTPQKLQGALLNSAIENWNALCNSISSIA